MSYTGIAEWQREKREMTERWKETKEPNLK